MPVTFSFLNLLLLFIYVIILFCSETALFSPVAAEVHTLHMLHTWASTELCFLFCSKPHQGQKCIESTKNRTRIWDQVDLESFCLTNFLCVVFLSFFSQSYLVPLKHTQSRLPSDCDLNVVCRASFAAQKCSSLLYFLKNLFMVQPNSVGYEKHCLL